MKNCSKCGELNPDEAKFCAKCGTPFAQVNPSQSTSNSSGGKYVTIIVVLVVVIFGMVVLLTRPEKGSYSSSAVSQTTIQQATSVQSDYCPSNNQSANAQNTIQSILFRLSKGCSKSGNQSTLSTLFASEIHPYVNWDTKRKASDIPTTIKQFLDNYDYYELSMPADLSVKPYDDGYVATYKITVEWNSQRTGHKKACIQKTTYFDMNYRITGFIDKELWRKSL